MYLRSLTGTGDIRKRPTCSGILNADVFGAVANAQLSGTGNAGVFSELKCTRV